MKKIPIFGSGLQAVSPFITAQKRLNAYYDVRVDGDKNKLIIRGTPGLTLFCTLPTSPIRGWIYARNFIYVVAGNTVYQVNQVGGYITIGTIGTIGTNSVNPVSMAINETQVMIVDGTNGYVFNYALITPSESVAQTTISSQITKTNILHQICYNSGNQ
jgi:hypothetical protein